jgi:hypothetical protein
MSRPTVLAFGVLVLLGFGLAVLTLPAQGPKEALRPETLSDKPVLVLSKQSGVAATLEQARIRSVGGRQFVVGKEMKDSSYTKANFAGGTIWIPLDDVTQLVELANTKVREE